MKKHLSLALLFCAPISQSLYAQEGELTPERAALLKHLAAIESFDQAKQLKAANADKLFYNSDVQVFADEEKASDIQGQSLADKILIESTTLTPEQAKEKIDALIAVHSKQVATLAQETTELKAKEAFKLQRKKSLEKHVQDQEKLKADLKGKSQAVAMKRSDLTASAAELVNKKSVLEEARAQEAKTKEELNARIEKYNALQSGATGWFKTYSKIS